MHFPYESGSLPSKSDRTRPDEWRLPPSVDKEPARAWWYVPVAGVVLAAVVAAAFYAGGRLQRTPALEKSSAQPTVAVTPVAGAATANVAVPSPALSTSTSPPAVAATQPAAPGLPMATNPLRWDDLVLMLRAGFSDNDIIATTAAKQWVVALNPTSENTLRQLGAGNLLIANLRSRRVYADPPVVANAAPRPAPVVPVALPADAQPTPTPFDYAARDRKLVELKATINQLDDLIMRARNHSGSSYANRAYGGLDSTSYGYAGMSLKQLEQKREEVRREKWALEGR